MSTPASGRTTAAPPSRRRRAVVWVLIVLASLLAFLSIMATWVNRQVLDNDRWAKTSAQIIRDPAVQSALSVYLVDQLYARVDVADALAQRLPPILKPLAVPAAGALRQPAVRGVGLLLERPRGQAAWVNANRLAQEKLVNVLENKTGNGISTGNGTVTINLNELVAGVGRDVGLPAAALSKIPPNAGTITVMRSDQLGLGQAAVKAIRWMSLWLVILVFALFAAAVYIAGGFRRRTLRNVGWAFVVVGILVLLLRRAGGSYATGALANAAYREPANHVWLIATSVLGEVGRAIVLYGLFAVLGAVLAGPTRAATAVRRRIAPVLNEQPGVTWGVTGFAFLLLVLWGGTHALRTWWGILLLGGLLAIGVVALRRETLAEFPDGRPGGPAPERPVGNGDAAELARLTALRDSGALSEPEYLRATKDLPAS